MQTKTKLNRGSLAFQGRRRAMGQLPSHTIAASFRGAARPQSIVKITKRPDGVAVLTIDDAAEKHNTITPAFGGELTAALDVVAADSTIFGVVIRSGKRSSFVVGANIEFLRSIRLARDAEEASSELARRFARLGALADSGSRSKRRKPVVAYIHGPALGAGFELALACTASVATDDPKTVVGFPEVKLGLVPAANGLFRVAERAGHITALELALSGKSVHARRALEFGLVDEVTSEERGLEAAVALALRLADEPKLAVALRKRRSKAQAFECATRFILEGNPLGRRAIFQRAREKTLERTRGHYPAAERVVDLLERFGSCGFAAAAKSEPRIFGELVVDPTAHRLIELFFAKTALKKETGLEPHERATPSSVREVAVVGAGLMGAGIAQAFVDAGLPVLLKDTDEAAVERCLRYVNDLVEARNARRSIFDDRPKTVAHVTGVTSYAGIRDADLVVEAVFENETLKQSVLREIEAVVRETCVIATNTSSIPIARIAQAASRPEMVVGMHYARPVSEMPLLEVVRSKRTSARAVATAVELGKRQGKVVIVVGDGVGFYTTRILVPLLNEAVHLVAEGAPVETIDLAMRGWGLRTGPLQLLDEIGIDGAMHAAKLAHAEFGARATLPLPFVALHADGRGGRKNARGFYLHGSAASQRSTPDATVYRALGVTPKPNRIGLGEIVQRCSLATINEALRCHGDGIVRSARDGDIGAIHGVGFPAFRGGPFRYVDIEGSASVLRQMRSLEQRFGTRFEPAPLLVEMARRAGRFYG
jgi:3-hydroxyacyl-CoA dehydrogenase/enoyl-CoA hydratase/3-hydroxybutyryl-CoA epimerase